MIKVLNKTFDVLEYVAYCRGKAVLPQEVVKALNLNQPTCMRIMKELTELGYLEQLGPRKGYVLGPSAFYPGNGEHYREQLYQAAAPNIESCARKIGQSVLLATRHGFWRYILCHYNYNARMPVNCALPRYDDLYVTASGRALMAFAPANELADILKKKGLPTAVEWPAAAANPSALERELAKIRRAEKVTWAAGMSPQLDVVAFPLQVRGEVIAAIGSSWLAEDRERIGAECIRCVGETAAQISALLNEGMAGG